MGRLGDRLDSRDLVRDGNTGLAPDPLPAPPQAARTTIDNARPTPITIRDSSHRLLCASPVAITVPARRTTWASRVAQNEGLGTSRTEGVRQSSSRRPLARELGCASFRTAVVGSAQWGTVHSGARLRLRVGGLSPQRHRDFRPACEGFRGRHYRYGPRRQACPHSRATGNSVRVPRLSAEITHRGSEPGESAAADDHSTGTAASSPRSWW